MRANSQPRRDIAKPSVGRRLRRIEHEDVQEPAMRLVLAAARLFNEHGIHATGIDRIIAEAGVARMTFYKHFGSKEGLVRAVMERESKAWFEWLDAELRRLQEPRQRISHFSRCSENGFHAAISRAVALSMLWENAIGLTTPCALLRGPIERQPSSISEACWKGAPWLIQINSPISLLSSPTAPR